MQYLTDYPVFCEVKRGQYYYKKGNNRKYLSFSYNIALQPTIQYTAPVERLYCKRPILCLASSKILTPHPLTAPQVCTPRLWCGGSTQSHSLGGEGGGGSINILEGAKHSSVLYICKYFETAPQFWAQPSTRSTPHPLSAQPTCVLWVHLFALLLAYRPFNWQV